MTKLSLMKPMMGSSRWRAFLALPVFLVACAATTPPPNIVPAASTNAVLQWVTPEGSTIFDAVFARSSDGAVAMDLYKGGPARIAGFLLLPDGRAWATGTESKRLWSGRRESAPARLGQPLAMAALYANEEELPDGNREIHSSGMRTAVEIRSGRLRSASVASMDTPSVISASFR